MRIRADSPVPVLAFTVGGFILAVAFLLLMMGGGFLLGLLLLALALVAAATMGVVSILTGREVHEVGTAAPFFAGSSPAGRAAVEQPVSTGLTEGESPTVILAGFLAGALVAVSALFTMMGGGFLLGLLVLAVTLVGAGSMGIASLVRHWGPGQDETVAGLSLRPVPEVAPAAERRSAAAQWRPLTWGLIGAASLTTFAFGTMILMHGVAHAWEDFRQDGFFYLPVVVGFGLLVGLLALLRPKGVPVRRSGAILAAAGTGLGTGALMACCVGTLAVLWQSPVLTSFTIALLTYKVLIVAAGVAMNLVGVLAVTRAGTTDSAMEA